MNKDAIPFTVINGAAGKGVSDVVASPSPPPLIDLSTSERRVWKYICDSLTASGLEHITAGLPIAIIVRTYSAWISAVDECNDKGRYQISGNGWSSETPWAADERRLKSELGQWLPKACLTIPSITKVKKEMGIVSGQDDLFSDLVNHAAGRPSASQS